MAADSLVSDTGALGGRPPGSSGGAGPDHTLTFAPGPHCIHCMPELEPSHHGVAGRHWRGRMVEKAAEVARVSVELGMQLFLPSRPSMLSDHICQQCNLVGLGGALKDRGDLFKHLADCGPRNFRQFGGQDTPLHLLQRPRHFRRVQGQASPSSTSSRSRDASFGGAMGR